MDKIHFQANWIPAESIFKIQFKIATSGSTGLWDINADKFLEMIQRAEKELSGIADGQNKVEKVYCKLQFVDKLGNDCEIDFSNSNRATFGQMVEYLRKVYNGWRIWRIKNGNV